jgi:hypothetical protein
MRRLLVLLALAGFATAATAQVRTIPQDAKLGEIRHVVDMYIEIDGQQRQLAPGAQIRDDSNRVIVPTALPAGAVVKYLVDDQGMVRQVWLLTSEEATQPQTR